MNNLICSVSYLVGDVKVGGSKNKMTIEKAGTSFGPRTYRRSLS